MDSHHRPVDDRTPVADLARIRRDTALRRANVPCGDPGGVALETPLLGGAVHDEVLLEVLLDRVRWMVGERARREDDGDQAREGSDEGQAPAPAQGAGPTPAAPITHLD